MPALTVPTIETYKPNAKRREIADTKARGLYLIIQPKPSGRRSWAVRLRRPDGTTAKITLGPYASSTDTSGVALTLTQARVRAAEIDNQRAAGVDVIAERKAAESRKQNAANVLAENSFGVAVREFIAEYRTSTKRGGGRPRRWREDASTLGLRYPLRSDPAIVAPAIIKGGLAEVWADKPVAKIDGHDIHSVVDSARKAGGDSRARKLHAALSVLFRFLHHQKRRITINPAAGVYRPGPPPARDVVLTDDGIRAFWKACDHLGGSAGALFKVLLLTGAREREVAGMSRAELGDDNVWTCPGKRTKNNRALLLPLPKLALDIIASVQGEHHVFPGRGGHKPIRNFSHLKERLDAEMAAILNGRPAAVHAETKEAAPWRIHDLRRTFGTSMQKLGIAQPVTERLLNHVSGSFAGVAGIYGRHDFDVEKADALDRWARHLERLVSNQPSNVVEMPAREQVASR
jgi:integrase